MNKFLLFSFILVFMTINTSFAQTVTLDFESPATGTDSYTWIVDDNGAGTPTMLPSTLFEDSTDPSNPTNTAAAFTANAAGQPWALIYADIPTFTFDATNNVLTMMVYKTVATPIELKFEIVDAMGNVLGNIAMTKTNLTTNAWELITFNFPSNAGTFNRVVIVPDNMARAQDNVVLLDNIQIPGILLPVEMLYFRAQTKEEGVELNWATASEINNDYFEVEHATDGRNFKMLEMVRGVGNSSTTQSYNILHNEPNQGLNYYRLKQVDIDGQFTYSDVVTVQLENSDLIYTMFPNPATDRVELKFQEEMEEEGMVQVFNSLGQLVTQQTLSAGIIQQSFDVSELPKGAYLMSVDINGAVYRKALIVN